MKSWTKLLLASACILSSQVHASDQGRQTAVQEYPGNAPVSCPSTDFTQFLRAFSNNVAVQKTFTANPFRMVRVDPTAQPEPGKTVTEMRWQEVQFPVLPLDQERSLLGLEIRIDSATGSNATITLSKPDTDYQVNYFFRREGCWILTSMEDWTL
jgi:hypothetical protein